MAKRGSPEWREKLSKAKIGRFTGKDNPFYGKSHSPESIEKIRLDHLGKKASQESRLKMSISRLGKKHPIGCGHCSEENRRRQSITLKSPLTANENHYLWKGDEVGYKAIHGWLRRNYGIPDKCEQCESTKRIEWANKNGKYIRKREEWIMLCSSCHHKYDNIVRNLGQYAKTNTDTV